MGPKGACKKQGIFQAELTAQKILSSIEPLPLSTPSSIRVGPFARQAQVSHLLDILISHLRDQHTSGSIDVEESDQIARTLTAFSMLLPEETPKPWPRYCGAIGMCYRYYSYHIIRNIANTPLAP